MNTPTTTHHVPADKLATFRRAIRREGRVITCSAPIGGDRYAVTVRVR
jgi:hypothetical protein